MFDVISSSSDLSRSQALFAAFSRSSMGYPFLRKKNGEAYGMSVIVFYFAAYPSMAIRDAIFASLWVGRVIHKVDV